MKRISIFLIALITLVGFTSSWVKNIQMLTKKISKESILVNQFEDIKSKDYYMKLRLFENGSFKLLKTTYFSKNSMQTETELYLKDSLFLEYNVSGIENRYDAKSNSFYNEIFEEIYYFKNKREGIIKDRKFRISSFNELPKAQIQLSEMEFNTREITEEDITKLEREYNSLNLLLKQN